MDRLEWFSWPMTSCSNIATTISQRNSCRLQHQPTLVNSSHHVKHLSPHSNIQVLDNHHHHHHTRFKALFPGLPRSASTRKVKPIWTLLKQETVSGSGISWAICKYAPCSRQTNHTSTPPLFFYRQDALLAAQPTASKH